MAFSWDLYSRGGIEKGRPIVKRQMSDRPRVRKGGEAYEGVLKERLNSYNGLSVRSDMQTDNTNIFVRYFAHRLDYSQEKGRSNNGKP